MHLWLLLPLVALGQRQCACVLHQHRTLSVIVDVPDEVAKARGMSGSVVAFVVGFAQSLGRLCGCSVVGV